MPKVLPKLSGRLGKMAKSDAHNLWAQLKEYESAELLFAKDGNVSFANNRAERDLRMSKVKQKVSKFFSQFDYAHTYCRIFSHLQTMAKKRHTPLISIQVALSGEVRAE